MKGRWRECAWEGGDKVGKGARATTGMDVESRIRENLLGDGHHYHDLQKAPKGRKTLNYKIRSRSQKMQLLKPRGNMDAVMYLLVVVFDVSYVM